jgi:hypothetical protein
MKYPEDVFEAIQNEHGLAIVDHGNCVDLNVGEYCLFTVYVPLRGWPVVVQQWDAGQKNYTGWTQCGPGLDPNRGKVEFSHLGSLEDVKKLRDLAWEAGLKDASEQFREAVLQAEVDSPIDSAEKLHGLLTELMGSECTQACVREGKRLLERLERKNAALKR